MPETGAKESRIAFVADAVITITNGQPFPPDVDIQSNGTVQFVNKDDVNYRIRLFVRDEDKHADVDLFLPARSSITVIAPNTEDGECDYEIHDASIIAPNLFDAAKRVAGGSIPTGDAAAGGAAGGGLSADTAKGGGGGGGGTIRIGPN